MRKIHSILLFAFLLLSGRLGMAQDDGARAYLPPPENLKALALFGVSINGNTTGDPSTVILGSRLNLDLLLLDGAWSYSLAGKSSLGFVLLPYGSINGKVITAQDDLRQEADGFGDLNFGTMVTVLGSPPMDIKGYLAYKPKASLGVLLMAGAPTGQYLSNSPVNMGANRWTFRAGLPFMLYRGASLADPKLLTFELLPSVTVFGSNDDPYNADRTSQDPMYRLEAHLSKSIHPKVFVSLDALYSAGGATQVDGVETAGSQGSLALGGTVNFTLNAKNSFKFTYGEVVSRNEFGMDGNMFRLIWTYVF